MGERDESIPARGVSKNEFLSLGEGEPQFELKGAALR